MTATWSISRRSCWAATATTHSGALGEERPAVRARYLDGSTVWLVTRYQDILTVLTDQRFSNDPTKQTGFDLAAVAGFPADVQPYMLHTLGAYDPPDHTRLRRLVSRAFTAKRVQHLRPHIQQITDELVEAMTHAGAVGGEVDLLEHLAYPLPIRVICELLGVPPGDQNRFRVWVDGLISRDPDQIAAGARSLIGYVSDLLEAKRVTPADDLLSALVGVHDEDGDRLSQEELVSVSITLLLAGYDTTVSLLGNGSRWRSTPVALRRGHRSLPGMAHPLRPGRSRAFGAGDSALANPHVWARRGAGGDRSAAGGREVGPRQGKKRVAMRSMSAPSSASPAQLGPRRGWWIITGMVLGFAVIFYAVVVVNLALPGIGGELAGLQWITSAYLLALAALLLPAGSGPLGVRKVTTSPMPLPSSAA